MDGTTISLFFGHVAEGGRHIASALKANGNRVLTKLDLGYNNLGPVGGKAIATLSLASNNLTNHGADLSGVVAITIGHY